MKTTLPRKKKTPFSRLPRWKQRVAIAKDALKQLRSQKYDATPVAFWGFPDGEDKNEDGYPLRNLEMCDIIKKAKKCTVCANGALFLSTVKITDNYTLGDSDGDIHSGSDIDKLSRYFTISQLRLQEIAFEQADAERPGSYNLSQEVIDTAIKWGRQRKHKKSRNKRLIALLENIIDNKGIFTP